MKHKRFSDEQVIGVLKEDEAGAKVDDICRRHAISSATFYTWRKKYGGMEASDARLPEARRLVDTGQWDEAATLFAAMRRKSIQICSCISARSATPKHRFRSVNCSTPIPSRHFCCRITRVVRAVGGILNSPPMIRQPIP